MTPSAELSAALIASGQAGLRSRYRLMAGRHPPYHYRRRSGLHTTEMQPMPLLTVEGIYKEGKVELTERPPHIEVAARVLVTFLPPGDLNHTSIEHEIRDRETL